MLSTSNISNFIFKTAVVLIVAMPFLAPFPDNRNADLQGIVILIAGLLSSVYIITKYKSFNNLLSNKERVLLIAIMVFALLSFLVNPHKNYDLLGAPYVRLGLAGTYSIIACSFLMSSIKTRDLLRYLYLLIIAIATISVPYTIYEQGTVNRIGGLFSQADIFAVFMGCGLLIGVEIYKKYPKLKFQIISSQILLVVLILLSQTRAVIFLVGLILIYLLITSQNFRKLPTIKWFYLVIGLVIIFASSIFLLPSRVTNASYDSSSITYRLSLVTLAIHSTEQKPLFGWGQGNIADALSCSKIKSGALQETCRQGYFFNSSHNIFIDQVLALGWIAGICFFILYLVELKKSLTNGSQFKTIGLCLVLIGGYLLTNVTNISLELLLWVLIIHLATKGKKQKIIRS